MRDERAELEWLLKYGWFEERPASILEFIGPDYCNIEKRVRQAIKESMLEIMGPEVDPHRMTLYQLAMITGAIGIGKTTIASIVIPYMTHWTLCLKDPQDFYELLPGSRIAFMQMSTSEDQARDVIFQDIFARIDNCPWFKKYPRDPKLKKEIHFDKDIWIIPGDSAETTFEGYNILGGILDEADSHRVTLTRDYAQEGYDTIYNRIDSRFGDRGFLLVIGQMKKATGFAAKTYETFRTDPQAYTRKMTIWESRGDDYYKCKSMGPHPLNTANPEGVICNQVHKFAFDVKRKRILPPGAALFGTDSNIMLVPEHYRHNFTVSPEKALKDLAGIPPMVGDPFISLVDRIEECRDRYVERTSQKYGVPVIEGTHEFASPVDADGRLAKWFGCDDPLERVVHVDIGYAEDGDALGIGMGHVSEMVEREQGGITELKPYIVVDFLMRMTAPPGDEIFLGDMRRVVYDLKFELGFKIKSATLDGFQSQDTIQQFRKKKIDADYLSIDRNKLPFEDLREAIYEARVEFPRYIVYLKRGDDQTVEIAVKELSELVDNGRKIDHPVTGSKDIADTLAGVVSTLMSSRRFRRGKTEMTPGKNPPPTNPVQQALLSHPAFLGNSGLTAPVPPSFRRR